MGADLLGREVARRTDDGSGPGQRGRLQGPYDPEVDDPRPVRRQQDVGRLEIPVHQAVRVDRAERLAERRGQHPHRFDGQRTVFEDGVAQVRPVDELRGHPRAFALGVRVHHPGDVRPGAADAPRGPHLLPEPGPERTVLGVLRPHHLHRQPRTARRLGEIHLAHAAGAESAQHPVRAYVPRIRPAQRLHPVPPGPLVRCVRPPESSVYVGYARQEAYDTSRIGR